MGHERSKIKVDLLREESYLKGLTIIYHKHRSSARTQFVRFSHGGVVGPESLPALTCTAEEDIDEDQQKKQELIEAIRDYFGLEKSEVCLDEDYKGAVETPSMIRPVYLVSIDTLDPPFIQVEKQGAKFIALTETRGLPDFELLLLQKAYKVIMEG